MEEKWSSIANLTLKELTLPGTHDSGSWSVTDELIGLPQWINTIVKVADHLGIEVGEIIDGWARSQTHNFFDQFSFGIRYVDVRIIYDDRKGVWRTHHGVVLGTNVEVLLQHTQQFLQNNTKEVIVLELSHETSTNATVEAELLSLIEKYLGNYLWPYSKGFVSLQEMIDAGKNVILTLPFGNDNDKIWPEGTIINSYANSPVLPTMEKYNVGKAREFATAKIGPKNLFKMSWTLTPNEGTIFEMIFPDKPHTLLQLADIANKDLVNWFQTDIEPIHFKYPILGNILIIDHYDVSAIVEIVSRTL